MPNLKGYTITYDGVASTTIPEFICHQVTRSLLGERRHSVENVPGLEGGWLFPEQPGFKTVKIAASIMVITWPLNRRIVLRSIANWLEKFTFRPLIISDEPDVFLNAVLNTSVDIDEWREKGTFNLEFLAQPYSYDTTIGTQSSTSSSFTVTASGDVFTEPVIEVTASGSGMTGLTININGRTIGYGAAVAATNKITINSISKHVTTGASIDTNVDGTYNVANSSMVSVTGLFPYLLPGVNTVTVVNGAGATVSVKWRNRYR